MPSDTMVVGGRISVSQIGGRIFHGTVYTMDRSQGFLVLKDVECITMGGHKFNLMTFRRDDIEAVDVLEMPKKKKKAVPAGARSVGRKTDVNGELTRRPVANDVGKPEGTIEVAQTRMPGVIASTEQNIHSDNTAAPAKMSPASVPVPDVSLTDVSVVEHTRPTVVSYSPMEIEAEVVIIDVMDKRFSLAIDQISRVKLIGVAMEGIDLGRDGQLCWVQIYASNTVFLFDIIKLGERAFSRGLRNIFQDPSIEKVVHDVRCISDLLFHQYRANIVNFFDTQVADLIVHMQNSDNRPPRNVTSLIVCLTHHITGLPMEHIYYHTLRESQKSDGSMWAERPLSAANQDLAVLNVIHLKMLKRRLTEAMLTMFIDGCDVYVGLMRDASKNQVGHMKLHASFVPVEFQNLQCHARRVRKRLDEQEEKEDQHTVVGATEESIFALPTVILDVFAPPPVPGSTLVIYPRGRRSEGWTESQTTGVSTVRGYTDEVIQWDDAHVAGEINSSFLSPVTKEMNPSILSPVADDTSVAIPGGHENSYLFAQAREGAGLTKASRKTSTEYVYVKANLPDVLAGSRLSGGDTSTSSNEELEQGRVVASKSPPSVVPLRDGADGGLTRYHSAQTSTDSQMPPSSSSVTSVSYESAESTSAEHPSDYPKPSAIISTANLDRSQSDLYLSPTPCSTSSYRTPGSRSALDLSPGSTSRLATPSTTSPIGRGQAMRVLMERIMLNQK